MLRRFACHTILQYGLEVYNPKLDKSKKPRLQTQVKILSQGKPIVEGKIINIAVADVQQNLSNIKVSGAIGLKSDLKIGDYVLELNVTDLVGKKTETQWIDFEIVGEKPPELTSGNKRICLKEFSAQLF